METAERHSEVDELLPWYVNGTLPRNESDAVERHLKDCPDCAAEIERQLGLVEQLFMLDDTEAAQARSWDVLRARIEAETLARTPQPRKVGLWDLVSNFRVVLALAGAVAAVALVAVVLTDPADDSFRTLTSGAAATKPMIVFQVAAGVQPEVLDLLLEEHGLVLVGEPSQTGAYRAAVAEGADLQAISDTLMSAPEILFAAPEAKP